MQWLDAAAARDVWRQKLAALPPRLQDVYFVPAYAALYADDSAHAECFISEDGERLYLYPFIRRPIPGAPGAFDLSTPYGYGGPISNSEDEAFLAAARAHFEAAARSRGVIAEVIKFHPLLQNHSLLRKAAYSGKITHVSNTVFVPMDVPETQRWTNVYTHANRKNVNKARRAEARFTLGCSTGAWEAFERLYQGTMAARQAESFYSFSAEYFGRIRQTLDGRHTLAAVTVGGRYAAVMLVLLGERFAHCHLLGTDPEFLPAGVNNFLHHELIAWCVANGYEALHIGGGRTPAPEDSLLAFKRNFSDQLAAFHVGECVFDAPLYEKLVAQWQERHPGKTSHKLLRYRE
jgi:hypothetical protein